MRPGKAFSIFSAGWLLAVTLLANQAGAAEKLIVTPNRVANKLVASDAAMRAVVAADGCEEILSPRLSELEGRLFAQIHDGRFGHFSLLEAGLIAGGVDSRDELRRYSARFDALVESLRGSGKVQQAAPASSAGEGVFSDIPARNDPPRRIQPASQRSAAGTRQRPFQLRHRLVVVQLPGGSLPTENRGAGDSRPRHEPPRIVRPNARYRDNLPAVVRANRPVRHDSLRAGCQSGANTTAGGRRGRGGRRFAGPASPNRAATCAAGFRGRTGGDDLLQPWGRSAGGTTLRRRGGRQCQGRAVGS